jgi:putative transposase
MRIASNSQFSLPATGQEPEAGLPKAFPDCSIIPQTAWSQNSSGFSPLPEKNDEFSSSKQLTRRTLMARIARVVIPNCPHHITHRGNRRQAVFFNEENRKLYLRLLAKYGELFGLHYWAYCLMDNHIHLIAVPERADSLNLTLREAHKKYTSQINIQMDWRGSLWQGRYYSFPLDDIHLYRAVRYTENNPVRAGMTKNAEDFPWSSAQAHVFGLPDAFLSKSEPIMSRLSWSVYLREQEDEEEFKEIRSHIMSGRPWGEDEFIDRLEESLGRKLRPGQPGRKQRSAKIDLGANSKKANYLGIE